MTAADQARAAAVVRLLTPRMVEVLREAAAGRLVRDASLTRRARHPSYIRGGHPGAVTQTAQALVRRGLVELVARGSFGGYKLTQLGAAVLARLAGQDGDRS